MKWLWRLGRLSSHRPIVLALVMLPTVSLLVLAGLSAWRTATDSEARVVEQRVTLARSVAQASSSFVNGHLSTVRSLALTRAITAPESQPGLEGFLQRVLAANSDWDSFGLYAEDGWTIVSTAAPPRGVNVADRPYFQQVLVSGAPVISPALVSRTTGRPVVALAAPVPFAGGGRGVLIAALATTNLRKALDALYGGEDFEIVVVDQQGQVLVHPDPVVVRALQPLGDRQAVIDVLAGGSGSYRSGAQRPRGSGGVEQLTTYAPLSGLDWGVLISQPAAVAFGPARRQLTLELVLLGLAAALTSSIAWLLGGRLARFYELQQAVAAQLSRQLAFTSAITRHLGEGVYALDRSGRLTFMNPAAERMLGWAEAELLGKPMHDIIHCRRNDESADTSRIAAAEDCPIVDVARRGVMVQEHDDTFVRRDGTSLPVAYTSSPIIAGNEIVGAVVAFHDITTSKESEAALRDAARMREEFLAMVSHELRTPLTAVMGYADILLRQRHGALNERQLRHAAGIREAAHRQLALVNDLLDVSKLEAGKVELRLRPVDCQAAITRAAAAMQVIAAEKGVELRVATADRAAPPALADDDRLHQ
ncbi:MAG: cache domain-containing protein, partial [Chloroflexota bacterium]